MTELLSQISHALQGDAASCDTGGTAPAAYRTGFRNFLPARSLRSEAQKSFRAM
jgi:hypothetical protein